MGGLLGKFLGGAAEGLAKGLEQNAELKKQERLAELKFKMDQQLQSERLTAEGGWRSADEAGRMSRAEMESETWKKRLANEKDVQAMRDVAHGERTAAEVAGRRDVADVTAAAHTEAMRLGLDREDKRISSAREHEAAQLDQAIRMKHLDSLNALQRDPMWAAVASPDMKAAAAGLRAGLSDPNRKLDPESIGEFWSKVQGLNPTGDTSPKQEKTGGLISNVSKSFSSLMPTDTLTPTNIVKAYSEPKPPPPASELGTDINKRVITGGLGKEEAKAAEKMSIPGAGTGELASLPVSREEMDRRFRAESSDLAKMAALDKDFEAGVNGYLQTSPEYGPDWRVELGDKGFFAVHKKTNRKVRLQAAPFLDWYVRHTGK